MREQNEFGYTPSMGELVQAYIDQETLRTLGRGINEPDLREIYRSEALRTVTKANREAARKA